MTDDTAIHLGPGEVYLNGRKVGNVVGRVVRTDPPGTWRVGRLLDTPQTRSWSPETRAHFEDLESRSVYEGFTAEDAGRGRRLIRAYDTAAEAQRAVRRHNRELAKFTVPRALAFFSGPVGPSVFQWTLALGWHPDLAKAHEPVPVRFAVEVSRQAGRWEDGSVSVRHAGEWSDPKPAKVYRAARWRIRIRSDFAEIETRIQYRAVGRYLVNRLCKGKVTPWALTAEEARLEGLAWRTESPVQAQVALRGVEAIRGVLAENGWPDRHCRMKRRGFFG